MIGYKLFIEGLREAGGLRDGQEAARVAVAVLNALAQVLPPPTRKEIAKALPASLALAVDTDTAIQHTTGDDFLIALAERLGTSPERARYVSHAVIEGLREQAAPLAETLFGQLPTDLAATLRPAGEPPDVAVTVDPGRPSRLTGEQVATALRGLPDWSGDQHALRRTVGLPSERHEPLAQQVEQAARASNDRVHIDDAPDAMTLRLHTGGDYVTEADVELAHRIDAIVAAFAG